VYAVCDMYGIVISAHFIVVVYLLVSSGDTLRLYCISLYRDYFISVQFTWVIYIDTCLHAQCTNAYTSVSYTV